MWYVLQVQVGSEQKICIQCEKIISQTAIKRCFLPKYKLEKRIRGVWQCTEHLLFPGYLFLESKKLELLNYELKQVIGFAKLLRSGEEITAIQPEEEALLKRLMGENEVAELSSGLLVGDKIMIEEGPLCGMEGYIVKFDRHKRKVWLEIPIFERTIQLQMGLSAPNKING